MHTNTITNEENSLEFILLIAALKDKMCQSKLMFIL